MSKLAKKHGKFGQTGVPFPAEKPNEFAYIDFKKWAKSKEKKIKKQMSILKDDRIHYVGKINFLQLTSLYKRSKYFLHLAWLDHCPNVVVDARASGCQIICSSAGGTKEIAGESAIIIEEEEWNFKPVKLYEPPLLDFSKKIKNNWDVDYNMKNVANKYKSFIEEQI